MPLRTSETPLWAERVLVADAAQRLAAAGLVRSSSGNVSARSGELVAVSPTGAELATLTPEDVTVVDLEGRVMDETALAPTSELSLHLAVHAERGDGAVIHTHAPKATAVGCVLTELPCIHYEMLALGGAVRVAPYSTFGSADLARDALAGLEGKNAVILANHGTVTAGPDMASALNATELLEWSAGLYLDATRLGTPHTLDADQQRAVIETAIRSNYGTTRPATETGERDE